MIVFFLIGCGLCAGGAWLGVARRREVERMIAVNGTVVGIHTRHPRNSRSVYNFPVIQFRTLRGETRTFTSETGDASRASRYFLDQTIELLYDPEGTAKPLINSWWGVWSAPFFIVAGGLLFIVVALNLWLALGESILGYIEQR